MPINVQIEKVLSLKEAAKSLPPIDGKRPHLSTIWRWCRVGLRGIHLEYVRFGSRIVTSAEALDRFVNALAATDRQPDCAVPSSSVRLTRTAKQRAVAINRAKHELAIRASI